MNRYVIRYQAADYSGERVVWADDEESALAKVRAQVRREMSLPMYSDSYRVVSCCRGVSS